MNPIQQMFSLQKQLNYDTNGAKWLEGKTKETREIMWYRCIYMEAAEAIDSFNWKHWKNINEQPDWDNIWVEMIDIWHFIMSEAIRSNNSKYADKYSKKRTNASKDVKYLLAILEQILSLSVAANIDKTKNSIRQIIDLFFQALTAINKDVTDLYQGYVVKNQLNIFRQKHGYKHGTYRKMWNGVEDNIVAFNLMKKQPTLTPDEMYQQLSKIYQQQVLVSQKTKTITQ